MAKAAAILAISATITARGQTTVPAAIRKMLALGPRDQVVFRGLADGTVVITKKKPAAEEDDPVIGKFLEFLTQDMTNALEGLRPVPRRLISRGKALVEGVEVDLAAPLPDDDA
jgi:antitoxin PrlF